MDSAEFFRAKAESCRSIAKEIPESAATSRKILALALELDARALAIEAGKQANQEFQALSESANGGSSA